jgi:hypothetical protein
MGASVELAKGVGVMRKWISLISLIGILMLLSVGCLARSRSSRDELQRVVNVQSAPSGNASYAGEDSIQAVDAEPAPVSSEETSQQSNESGGNRLIIRRANLNVEVRVVRLAVESVGEIASMQGGYVVSSDMAQNHNEDGCRATVVLRVPGENYESAMMMIRDVATEVKREYVSGEDVTEEYVDLKSRLRHLEATEERLMDFLYEAEDTEAALTVHDRLRNIEAETEQVKGRMQYLEQSAAMATITISMVPDALSKPVQVERWSPGVVLRDAIERLVKTLQQFVDVIILLVVLYLPTLLVISLPFVGLFFLVRAIAQRIRRKRET